MAAQIIQLPGAAPSKVKNPPYGVKLWRGIPRIPSFGYPKPTPTDQERFASMLNNIEILERTAAACRAKVKEITSQKRN